MEIVDLGSDRRASLQKQTRKKQKQKNNLPKNLEKYV